MASSSISDSSDALLTRQQTGIALRAAGYPIAAATLATRASRGGGPPYRRFGARVLYRWSDVLGWAESRLSGPVFNTSESDADANRHPNLLSGSENGRSTPQRRPARLVANAPAI
jgi:hypothetical protein